MDGQAGFREATKALGEAERLVLTLLALTGPQNITNLCELAHASGVHESATRKISTTTLRPVLEALIGQRLVVEERSWFRCALLVRHPTLRRAVADGSLARIVTTVTAQLFPRSHYAHDGLRRERLAFELAVGLSTLDPRADDTLTALLLLESAEFVTDSLLLPALLAPFDEAWFVGLPQLLRTRLLDLVLTRAEALGLRVTGLYEHLAAHVDLVLGSPDAHAALAGIALLRNDFDLAGRLATLGPTPDVRCGIEGSLALLQGHGADAAPRFTTPAKKQPLHRGLAGVLQVLAFLRRGGPDDLELSARLCAAGTKKGRPFRQTHGILSSIVQATGTPSFMRMAPHLGDYEPPSDCFAPIARLLFATWFEVPAIEREISCRAALELRPTVASSDTPWLLGQYDRALLALSPKLEDPIIRAAAGKLARPEAKANVFPLGELRTTKTAWERALEGLERLARASSSLRPEADQVTDERLIWKVDAHRFDIEPFVQKRTAGAWTRGRKLAIKHLLHGAAGTRKWPPEDAKIAAFAREYRESYGGYPQVIHFIDRKAWPSLIGHPRVFVGDEERHAEVTRGTVQLLASTRGDQFVLTLDPPDLSSDLEVRFDGERVLVFETAEPLRSLVNLVGKGLSVPVSAQTRALEVLGGLAHIVPVQSSEQIVARAIDADSRPWLRLLPRGGGLLVSMSIRPLGSDGPHVKPGHGARTLVGRSKGEPVQTERNLDEERALAERVVKDCEALQGNESGDGTWLTEDPEACLELLSSLARLADNVHVEWPQGTPLKLRARLGTRSLRGQLRRDGASFFAAGTLAVDEGLSLGLDELVALLAERPGKFVRLESGEYVELEQQLREVLESLASFPIEGRSKQPGIAIPVTALPLLERLTEADSGLELDHASLEWRKRLVQATDARVPIPRGLNAELREYQVLGFRWLARLAALELGACLADDMGLGKTVQLIALLLHRGRIGPALVVAPTSVCDNWQRELARFAPSLGVRSYVGAGREQALEKLSQRQVVLTSYALLQQDAEILQGIEWSTVVLDEAQLIKNAESQRAKAAYGLRAAVRIAATGTPVENHTGDVFSIFHFLMPGLLGSWARFNRRFGANATGESGATGRRALRRLLLPFVLRRTKAQVLEDLPPLTEIERTVTLGAEEAALYEAVRRTALAKLRSGGEDARGRFQVLAEITRLRRLCCHPQLAVPGTTAASSKVASFLELVEELREGRHRALVFSQFVDVLTLVRAELDRRSVPYQYLDGSTVPKQRTRAVDAFQAGEGDLFLISLRAGGFGLNLTGADYVIHLDPWWNPAVEAQASNRAHRIGQTRPVTVYRLVAAGTVEERIVALHRSKRELADSLLEDTDRAAILTAEDLRALLDD